MKTATLQNNEPSQINLVDMIISYLEYVPFLDSYG